MNLSGNVKDIDIKRLV